MKKVFLVVVGLLMMHMVSAQIFVNKKNLADVKDVEFIVLSSYSDYSRNFKVKVELPGFSDYATDENGQKIIFVNLSNLVNTFYKSGWVFHTFKRNEQAIFRRRHD